MIQFGTSAHRKAWLVVRVGLFSLNASRNVCLSGDVYLLSDSRSCQIDNTFTFSSGKQSWEQLYEELVISSYFTSVLRTTMFEARRAEVKRLAAGPS